MPRKGKQHEIMGKTRKRTGWYVLLIVVISGFYQCTGEQKGDVAHKTIAKDHLARQVDSSAALLRSGDLVVRTGNDGTSYLLAQLNQKDKTYSHCGIVMVEDGYPFVYHSIGGEDNPDEELRRDSANFWFSPQNNLGFGIARYDLTAAQVDSLGIVVRQYYRQRKKFDMDFDLESEDRFYCAEFIYRSLTSAVNDPAFIQTTVSNGHRFVGVDDLFLTPHARLICQIRFK